MGYPVDDGVRSSVPYTIPAGATGLGPAISLGGYRLAGVVFPSGWVAAAITFQVQDPLTNVFYDLYDDAAAEVAIASITAPKAVAIVSADLAALQTCQVIKIRSGTTGANVNQTGAPTLTLVLIPLIGGS